MPGKVLSQERVSLSDVEDESPSGSDVDVRANGVAVALKGDVKVDKRKPMSDVATNGNTPQASKRAKMTASRADPSPSSSSSSDDDDDVDEDKLDNHTPDIPLATVEPDGQQAASTPYVYNPPEGFVEMRKPNPPNANLNKLFAPDNLAGKQIWHITLPADVPVSSLKDIDIEKAQSGATVLSHGGVGYGFRIESHSTDDKKAARLLLTNNGGLTYSAAPQTFDNNLILQQSQHPTTSHKSSTSSSTGVVGAARPNFPTVKGVRQQPANLRARYFPSGFEEETSTASNTNSKSTNKDSAAKSSTFSDSESSEEESEEEL